MPKIRRRHYRGAKVENVGYHPGAIHVGLAPGRQQSPCAAACDSEF
jgi:hypothetical protein